MSNVNKDLVRRWYNKSQEDGNIFDKFISLWIPFNAYYAANNLKASERDQLEQFKNSNKVLFLSVVQENTTEFVKFKEYIEIKPQNTGFIQDLKYRVGEEGHKKRYQNLQSLCEYQSCIYQIRCNLFHGGKDVTDTQDEKLVKLAFYTLSIFLKKVFENENILSL